ncbi:hypothetical protein [Polaribacter sp. SA4-12]|uniref:hypothetical protein n=1 Tax=Polaribacter sp. SA4-12 TaxID=1312072 RepID=UPI000B3CCF3F|nr:hypothetical protein [Polaribacter sp. SA4-12]ARV16643.1 hypothetical protein BTO07_16525 [Polaribacter sp. SA4-12]
MISILQTDINAFSLVIYLSAISLSISSLEWLWLSKKFKNNNFYGWNVREVGSPFYGNTFVSNILGKLFKYPNVLLFFILQLSASISILVSIFYQFDIFLECLLIAISLIVLSLRNSDGTMGSDQITKIVFVVGVIAYGFNTQNIYQISLYFITSLLFVAYLTSGWIRILQPTWRNGKDLMVVLRQHTYGNKTAWKLGKKHPKLIGFVSLLILIFECFIPITLILPIEWVFFYLFLGVLFHFMNAVILGLNTFFWSFIALYPALIWVCLTT